MVTFIPRRGNKQFKKQMNNAFRYEVMSASRRGLYYGLNVRGGVTEFTPFDTSEYEKSGQRVTPDKFTKMFEIKVKYTDIVPIESFIEEPSESSFENGILLIHKGSDERMLVGITGVEKTFKVETLKDPQYRLGSVWIIAPGLKLMEELKNNPQGTSLQRNDIEKVMLSNLNTCLHEFANRNKPQTQVQTISSTQKIHNYFKSL